ncbi:major facilitator superfamily domain-containing protein [Usnea florida]
MMERTEGLELTADSAETNLRVFESRQSSRSRHTVVSAPAIDAIPDGDYGWTVVFACSVVTFTVNGWSGSWGILQTALSQTYPGQESTTSLSFVGSLSIALCVGLGLACIRLSHLIGARRSMLLGVLLMSFGSLSSSFTVKYQGGLFVTAGISFGIGSSLAYTMSNNLPVQWFSSRLGTANGLVKLGALINKMGIPWTFRILGFVSLTSGIPAALLVREREPSNSAPFADLTLFKSVPFCCLFLAGAVGTFALFVPMFFLPLFAHSIGLSASTGAGSTNMLLLTMALNAASMLGIWPISGTIGPLIVFAIVNGVANGAFFVTMPTAVSRMMRPDQAAVGMGMAITGWTGGYLMGSPIAGILIATAGAQRAYAVAPYRVAIFYAGGVALASAAFVLAARLAMDTKVMKKL